MVRIFQSIAFLLKTFHLIRRSWFYFILVFPPLPPSDRSIRFQNLSASFFFPYPADGSYVSHRKSTAWPLAVTDGRRSPDPRARISFFSAPLPDLLCQNTYRRLPSTSFAHLLSHLCSLPDILRHPINYSLQTPNALISICHAAETFKYLKAVVPAPSFIPFFWLLSDVIMR